jgi:hypothetical protein
LNARRIFRVSSRTSLASRRAAEKCDSAGQPWLRGSYLAGPETGGLGEVVCEFQGDHEGVGNLSPRGIDAEKGIFSGDKVA